MKELRNLPLWAMILSLCVAAAAAVFVVMGMVNAFTGAGADLVLFDALIAAALALGAWSIAVKGNPALSRRRRSAPNRRSPTRW
ncbi:hypothetical protein [Arthrobacter sp. H35-D1]|uniref:hypothetical protein n=1 Tax=Arthrobacter sp. H35-D1 TaxID=3046202 RepID=UPI0024BB8844|nr:hypothetical protein [Arthrobacter sp. H35-D1]MDJ0311656.1 hypothetical protein [Arthrobacter sp. H35-D1]